jgi:5,10-methylenetetrahydromethanopterin reductase
VTGPVEIGLGVQSDKSDGEYAALAALAEGHGFDVLSVYGDLLFQPPVYPLLEMARATSRVRLGAACWNPYTMHPYEIAGQLAALQQASGGRAYLGLTRGAWMSAIGVRQDRPVATLREAVAVIRALLRGEGEGVDGAVFQLTPGTRLRYPCPYALPPVLIGAWGPATAAMAGEVADEVKIGGTANPDMIGVMRERLAPGLALAGRPDGAVGVVAGAVTVVDKDGEAARARARREVAMYIAVIGRLDPTLDLPPGLLAEISQLVDQGQDENAGRLIPDDVLDVFAFSGTPDQVAAQAQRLIDAGASRIEFGTPHGLDGRAGIDLLGRAVLPALERPARQAR